MGEVVTERKGEREGGREGGRKGGKPLPLPSSEVNMMADSLFFISSTAAVVLRSAGTFLMEYWCSWSCSFLRAVGRGRSGYMVSVMLSMLSSISEKLWSSQTIQRVTSGITRELNLFTRSCERERREGGREGGSSERREEGGGLRKRFVTP